jgi:hypothetical protein
MTDIYWYGADAGNEGDASVLANWQEEDGTAAPNVPGAAAGTTDNIICDARVANAMDTSCDLSAGAGDVENVRVLPGCLYPIGTATEPLIVKLGDTPELLFANDEASCLVYLVCKTTDVALCEVARSGSAEDAINLCFNGIQCTRMVVAGGNVKLPRYLDGNLGGSVTNLELTTGAHGQSGVVRSEVAQALVELWAGTFYWNYASLTKMEQYGGRFSAVEDQRDRTITNMDWDGGVLDLRTGRPGAITVSNAIKNFGGGLFQNFFADPGQQIQFTNA